MKSPLHQLERRFAPTILGVEARTGTGTEAVQPLEKNQRMTFHYAVLQRQREQLEVLDNGTELASLEELVSATGTSVPVALTITGKGILHKRVNLPEGHSTAQVIAAVLPHASVGDYYCQEIQQEQDSWVSLVRKSTVDELLEQFQAAGFRVVSVSLGGFDLLALQGYFPNLHENIEAGRYRLEIRQGAITDYSESEPMTDGFWKVGLESLPLAAALALGTGFAYFFGLEGKIQAIVPRIQQEQEELRYQRWFNRLGGGLLLFFALLLGGNYGLQSHYEDRLEELYAASASSAGRAQDIEALQAEIQAKRQLVGGLLNGSTGTVAAYMDQLAASVPQGMRLQQLAVCPLEGKAREGKPLLLESGHIRISGKVPASDVLHSWIGVIHALPWVDNVTLNNYRQGIFQLDILLA